MIPAAEPIFKWPGGKRSLAEKIRRVYDGPPARRYGEAFLGGGSTYFARVRVGELRGVEVVLADAEPRLMASYRGLQLDVEAVIRALDAFEWGPGWRDQYADRRDALNDWKAGPEEVASPTQAALFLWMNRACFNGLWRVSSSGKFNSPAGSYTRLSRPTASFVREIAEALAGARLLTCRFQEYFATVDHEGAQEYFDPPYFGVFDAYTPEGFPYESQVELARACAGARDAGAMVVASNSNRPEVRGLYGGYGFELRTVSAPRSIAAKGDARGQAAELLAVGMPRRVAAGRRVSTSTAG